MTGRERGGTPAGGEPVGLYLHIPFCRSKCPFCDFCSFPRPDAAMVEAYVDELIRRIRLSGAAEAAAAGGVQALDTVYIGGGTPTLLTPSQAARLMEAVHAAFFVLPDAEVTVEGNPAALTAEGLAAFRAGGVNRLSLGVQSANADELRALGRLHSFPDAVRAVATARAVGIGNISLDFMIGIPGQTPDSLRRTLEAALALEPEHLSAYCLSLEPGTPFGRRGRAGLGLPADEDEAAEQASALYELSARLLSAAGYEHYEISNYARPGMRSRHNLHTWQDKPYIGLGVGAYSYLHGVRFGQSRDLSAFLDSRDITVDRYIPDRREQMEEYIMLCVSRRVFPKQTSVPASAWTFGQRAGLSASRSSAPDLPAVRTDALPSPNPAGLSPMRSSPIWCRPLSGGGGFGRSRFAGEAAAPSAKAQNFLSENIFQTCAPE